ncbi:D-xylose transport system permease protein [Frankia sp. Hr75.2]|nr:D-xylose transport system permease protein [Frankia sp. Hr75.2]
MSELAPGAAEPAAGSAQSDPVQSNPAHPNPAHPNPAQPVPAAGAVGVVAPGRGDAAVDPRLLFAGPGLRGLADSALRHVRAGELGSLPVIVGLVVIWTIFQFQNSNFLTSYNLTNLALQVAATGTIATGVFLVLLLGEIDLSVGWVSGLCASVMAVLSVRHGWAPVLAIVAALVVGAAVGALQGSLFAVFGVPSFVVTLAGFIAWQGVQLKVLGRDGSLNLPDSEITKLTSTFFTDATGWVIAGIAVAGYAGAQLAEVRGRRRAGLRPRPIAEVAVRVVVVGGALIAAVAILNDDRGLPLALLIFGCLVLLVDLVSRRTSYGRHLYAVGGNVEAARRAGINVRALRVSAFAAASCLAGVGGVLAAARLTSVTQASGGSDTLLNAIAAAVIGGTSLFGGRGRAWSALLGILVIGSIANGMDLLGLDQSVKFIITGSVLLAAVLLDAAARRGRQASGRG